MDDPKTNGKIFRDGRKLSLLAAPTTLLFSSLANAMDPPGSPFALQAYMYFTLFALAWSFIVTALCCETYSIVKRFLMSIFSTLCTALVLSCGVVLAAFILFTRGSEILLTFALACSAVVALYIPIAFVRRSLGSPIFWWTSR
jgi:hypothetical protein